MKVKLLLREFIQFEYKTHKMCCVSVFPKNIVYFSMRIFALLCIFQGEKKSTHCLHPLSVFILNKTNIEYAYFFN